MNHRHFVQILLATAALEGAALSGCTESSAPGEASTGAGGAGTSTWSGAGGAVVATSTGNGGGAATTGSGASTTTTATAGSSSATAGAGGSSGSGSSGSSSSSSSSGSSSGSGGPVMQPFKGVANSPCASRTALKVSWYYNWTQNETEPCSNGQGGEFIPMIWGHAGAEQSAPTIQSAVSSFVNKGYKHVLGFNEPDNTGQSNITAAKAISLLPSFDNPAILVGTAATQANATGQTWFKDYMGQVNASPSLRADFIAIHWYGWNAGSCDAKASQLESYIKYAEGFGGNRPIWLTEWGCLNLSAPTVDGVVSFYKGALAVFAKHPRVQRYAWYPWATNCGLNNADGSLTPLGVAYAAAESYK